MSRLDSWGEFYCPRTAGWTPVQMHDHILPPTPHHVSSRLCLGVAARFKKAVQSNPAFAATELPPFTIQEMKTERDRFRWTLLLI